MALLIPILGFWLLFLLGCLCGLFLFFQWVLHLMRRHSHIAWSKCWALGLVAVLIGLVTHWAVDALTPAERYGRIGDTFGFVSSVLLYGGPLLWIWTFILFYRVKTQKSISMPRYDEPQEGVWPPPPTNTPRQ